MLKVLEQAEEVEEEVVVVQLEVVGVVVGEEEEHLVEAVDQAQK